MGPIGTSKHCYLMRLNSQIFGRVLKTSQGSAQVSAPRVSILKLISLCLNVLILAIVLTVSSDVFWRPY